MDYQLIPTPPDVDSYCHLRASTGLSPKSKDAANRGLAGTYYGVSIVHNTEIVGMGRIIGDGGCFFQIVDIAVLSDHQGQGLGKLIMSTLMDYLRENVPTTAHVTLLADGEAHNLYRQYGFEFSAPRSQAMVLRL
jgi:ribosomal protein S18 acetylase RimI-like enzyme